MDNSIQIKKIDDATAEVTTVLPAPPTPAPRVVRYTLDHLLELKSVTERQISFEQARLAEYVALIQSLRDAGIKTAAEIVLARKTQTEASNK